jgi:hypothetical protein
MTQCDASLELDLAPSEEATQPVATDTVNVEPGDPNVDEDPVWALIKVWFVAASPGLIDETGMGLLARHSMGHKVRQGKVKE